MQSPQHTASSRGLSALGPGRCCALGGRSLGDDRLRLRRGGSLLADHGLGVPASRMGVTSHTQVLAYFPRFFCGAIFVDRGR
jgi:hypothetical protein